jgi:hypothetical protein
MLRADGSNSIQMAPGLEVLVEMTTLIFTIL